MGELSIKVMSAVELDEPTKAKVNAFLAKKHPKGYNAEFLVDGSVLGGILIIDGNDYYDGTVRSQLIKIRKSL